MKIKKFIRLILERFHFKSQLPIPLSEYDKMKIENLMNKELKTKKLARNYGDNNRDISAI